MKRTLASARVRRALGAAVLVAVCGIALGMDTGFRAGVRGAHRIP
jgi:hypothetical protein